MKNPITFQMIAQALLLRVSALALFGDPLAMTYVLNNDELMTEAGVGTPESKEYLIDGLLAKLKGRNKLLL